jgi:putative transposase
VILDLHAWRILNWAVSNRVKRNPAIRPLRMTTALRSPDRGRIARTGRASQYSSQIWQKILRERGFKTQMNG